MIQLMSTLLTLAVLVLRAHGQMNATTDIPMILDGALDDATVADDTYNSAGTITVNGWTVNVPTNMLVTFPNMFVPWPEVVAQKELFLGFEVNVAGNIVNGISMAAQIYLWQYQLEFNQGYVTAVNYDGTMKIQNGPVIRINDPNGVFGVASDGGIPFFVADDQNPSVTSFSGFPMCVPRSAEDALCPSSNRPAGQMTFQAPDPLVMVPFRVGDYLNYAGVKNAAGEIVCYEIITMNVQVTTTGNPSYVRVEAAQIGVYSNNSNAEIQESRFIGYTSDPAALVSVSALIIDPCTGQESEQPLGVGELRPDPGGRNKFTARIDGNTYINYSREYRLSMSTGTTLTKNGILAGQYVQPVAAWIQPELLVPGIPPIPNEFEYMTQLTQGVAYDERTGNFFGPLSPFPQSSVYGVNTSTCPGAGSNGSSQPIPTISAVILFDDNSSTSASDSGLFVRPGDRVRLTGGQSNPNITTAEWQWSLVNASSVGAASNLNITVSEDNSTYMAEFPASGAPTGSYVFQLNITEPASDSKAAVSGTTRFNVTLFSGADTVTVDSVTWTSAQSGTIGVVCSSSYWVDADVGMKIKDPTSTVSMSATPPNSGRWSFSSRSVDRPGTVVCTSRLGGSATQVGVSV